MGDNRTLLRTFCQQFMLLHFGAHKNLHFRGVYLPSALCFVFYSYFPLVSDLKLWFSISHFSILLLFLWQGLYFSCRVKLHLGNVVTAAVIKTCKLYLYPPAKWYEDFDKPAACSGWNGISTYFSINLSAHRLPRNGNRNRRDTLGQDTFFG